MQTRRQVGLVLVTTVAKSAFEQEGIKLIQLENEEADVRELLAFAERTQGVVTTHPADFPAIQAFERQHGINLQPDGGCLAAHTLRVKKGTVVIATSDRAQFANLPPNSAEAQWDRAIAATNFTAYAVVKMPRSANAALIGANEVRYTGQPEPAGARSR